LQKIRDASGEVSSIETGEKNLKIAKALRYSTSPESSRKGGGGIYRPLA